MANENSARNEMENFQKQVQEQQRALGNARILYQRAHQHHPNVKNGVKLVEVTNAKTLNDYGLPEGAKDIYKCSGNDGCGKVFSAAAYTEEQVNAMSFQLDSMLEQMKFNSPEGDFPGGKAQLDQFYAAIEILDKFFAGYNEMIKKQNKGDDNKNGGNHRQGVRGGVGPVNYYGRGRNY